MDRELTLLLENYDGDQGYGPPIPLAVTICNLCTALVIDLSHHKESVHA